MVKLDYAQMQRETEARQRSQNETAARKVPEKETASDSKSASEQTGAERPISEGNPNTVMMGFRVTPEQRYYLKETALRNGMTTNDIIRQLIARMQSGDIKLNG